MLRRLTATLVACLAGATLAAAPAGAAPATPAPVITGIVRADVAAWGTVATPNSTLTVRTAPSTSGGVVKSLANGTRVGIICQTPGTTVTGTYGTSAIWDMIGPGQYVADAYVYTGVDGYVAPRCGTASTGYALVDNYPYRGATGGVDPWNFYKGQCTSWAAWAVNNRLGIAFHNYYKGQHWGNAHHWDDAARAAGLPVSTTPRAGNVAVSNNGTYGHVAFVARVNADGSYVVEEYNWKPYAYSVRTIPAGGTAFQYFVTMR